MYRPIYNNRNVLIDEGEEFVECFGQAVRPVFQEYLEKGFSPRDLAFLGVKHLFCRESQKIVQDILMDATCNMQKGCEGS